MPEDVAGGDFETRSAVNLTKTGVYRYAEHPTTQPWCLSWYMNYEPVQLWEDGDPPPERLLDHVRRGGKFVSWNVQFERVNWNYTLAARRGWPKLTIEQTWCTQAQALCNGLPAALDKAADALGLTIRKDPGARRLMLQMCKPRFVNADGSCLWWDDRDRRKRLGAYCVNDSEMERTIASRLRPMSESEREIWVLDQKINERGYMLDFELVHAGLTMVGQAVKQLDHDVRELTKGMVANTRKRTEILNWLWLHGDLNSEVDSIDKHALAVLLKRDDLTDATRSVLTIRQESAKSSTAKLHTMQKVVCRDGRVRGTLQYYGAGRTGRWAGRLVQPHNFPKGHIKADEQESIVSDVKQADSTLDFGAVEVLHGPPLDVMSSLLRGTIIAAPAKELLVADWSAIEARILAWLAGQRDLVHLFASGGDPYKTMAAKVFKVPRIQVDGPQRFIGKTLVLSCGYQCAWENLQIRMAKEGIEISEDDARQYIVEYRSANGAIVDFWGRMDTAAKNAIANPGVVYSNGKLAFGVKHGMLYMKLPSGRFLTYIRPTVESVTTMREGEPWTRDQIFYWGVDPISYQWARLYTYGGKLTENAVQAIARDVLAAGMIRVQSAGYDIVLHVHDEIVSEVPTGWGSLDQFEHLAAMVPDWLEGCPLKVETWRGRRYRK